jgi:hypothetical protein
MDDPIAQFPASIFDGKSESRPTGFEYVGPEANDWLQILNEIIAIQKAIRPAYDDLTIWVSPTGVAATATGSITNPYPTIASALAAASAARKNICLMPGTYIMTSSTTITKNNIKIIGLSPSNTIIAGGDVNQVFSILPGAIGAPFVINFENLTIVQSASTDTGLHISDADTDDTMTVNLINCTFTMDNSGPSVNVLHTVNQAFTLNITGGTYVGGVTVDCINASDNFNFTNAVLGDIVSDAGAVAASFLFKYCTINGVSGGHSNQTIESLYCLASDNTLASTGLFTGSHTETTIAPVSQQ